MAYLTETATQREMAGGLFAGGEMMMVPTFRRHEQAPGLPIDANKFAPRPHQRITLAGWNFCDDHPDEALRTLKMAVCRGTTPPLPAFEGRGFQIFDSIAG
jgi:hypothetical protein